MTGAEQARGQFDHHEVMRDSDGWDSPRRAHKHMPCLPRVQRGSMYSKIECTEGAVGLKVHFWRQAGKGLSFTETNFGTRRAETLDHDGDVTHPYCSTSIP